MTGRFQIRRSARAVLVRCTISKRGKSWPFFPQAARRKTTIFRYFTFRNDNILAAAQISCVAETKVPSARRFSSASAMP